VIRASRNEYLSQAFLIDESDLTKLTNDIMRFIGPPVFTCLCSDRITRQFDSLNAFLSYENSPSRKVEVVRLRARSEDFSQEVSLRFSGETDRNINVDVSGDEDTVLALSDAIEDRLSGIRPWYWRIASASTSIAFWALYILIVAVVPLFRSFRAGMPIGQILSPKSMSWSWSVGLGFVALGILLKFAIDWLDRMKRAVFPMASFAIGQGAKRHRDMELIRTVVVIGFVISLLSSFAASALL
jgi:hypothetical protein